MKLLLLLLRSLLLTIFIVLLTTCNASESDTNIPKNSESVQIPENEKAVQIPEDENWKIFEDNRSGITFSYPSIWKTLDEENTIVLEGPLGHIIFQDISVPADELDQVAKDMFDKIGLKFASEWLLDLRSPRLSLGGNVLDYLQPTLM